MISAPLSEPPAADRKQLKEGHKGYRRRLHRAVIGSLPSAQYDVYDCFRSLFGCVNLSQTQ